VAEGPHTEVVRLIHNSAIRDTRYRERERGREEKRKCLKYYPALLSSRLFASSLSPCWSSLSSISDFYLFSRVKRRRRVGKSFACESRHDRHLAQHANSKKSVRETGDDKGEEGKWKRD
jgi:hypothetical protein